MTKYIKSILFLACIQFFCFSEAVAQVRFGVRAAPGVGYNRVSLISDNVVATTRTHFVIALGVFSEFELTNRYRIKLGLHYLPRQISVDVTKGANSFHEKHNIQHLSFAPSAKFLTGQLFSYTHMYFEIGPVMDVKIHEAISVTPSEASQFLIEKINLIDVGIRVEIGFEVNVLEQTDLGIGLSYVRGLIDLAGETKNLLAEETFSVRQDRFELSLYVKL